MRNNEVRYFIYEDNLNGDLYLRILDEVVGAYIDDFPLDDRLNLWYQMDGAPPHSTRAVDRSLTDTFQDRWIGNRGPMLWPPRSPDLTPLDFYLWGRIKALVYGTPIANLNCLRQHMVEAFNILDANEIRSATQSVGQRIVHCLVENVGHIEHL